MALSARKAKLWLLYLKRFPGSLSVNVIREICSFISDMGQIAQITPSSLRFFDHQRGVWKPLVRLISGILVDESSTWIVCEDGRVFCSGGGSKSQAGRQMADLNEAYLLDREGIVSPLPGMSIARGYHGVIQVLHIYVFGGCRF